MILLALPQYAGLTPIAGDIFILNCSGDSFPVLAIVITSHGNSKCRLFSDKVKTGSEGVLQLQILVIRYSHGHSPV